MNAFWFWLPDGLLKSIDFDIVFRSLTLVVGLLIGRELSSWYLESRALNQLEILEAAVFKNNRPTIFEVKRKRRIDGNEKFNWRR